MTHLLLAAVILGSAHAQLRITVYDRAGLPNGVREGAFSYLCQIFRASGIEIEFRTGDMASDEASIITYPAVPRKGQELATVCRARRDIALQILANAPRGVNDSILGMAVPLAWEGLNARVFNDHVRVVAFERNRAHEVVLAHAIAHEIGHVLLRTHAHSSWGIMSAVWTDNEYRWTANNLMFFTRDQSMNMRAALRGEGCTDGASVEILQPRKVGSPLVR